MAGNHDRNQPSPAPADAPDTWDAQSRPDCGHADSDESAAIATREKIAPPDQTLLQFVTTRFFSDHISAKTSAGQRHYQAILKYVLTPGEVAALFGSQTSGSRSKLREDPNWPYLSNVRLCDAQPDHVRRIVYAAEERGYSSQTIRHILNVVGAIFSHAIKHNCLLGNNPARMVAVPKMERRESHSLTLSQTTQLLQRMQYPEREVALMALLTPMNIAEICGLQWMFVNLTDNLLTREGQLILPRSILVCSQLYRGRLCDVPLARRKEVMPPPLVLNVLRSLSRIKTCGWHDFVLSTKLGRPINPINLAARRLKRLGNELEMPWLSWQVLRRTRGQLIRESGMQVQDHLARAVLLRPQLMAHPSLRKPSA